MQLEGQNRSREAHSYLNFGCTITVKCEPHSHTSRHANPWS